MHVKYEYTGEDTLESFLSKVGLAVESDMRKKLASCKNRTGFNRESLFRKKNNCDSFRGTRARLLSKVTFDSYFQKKTQCGLEKGPPPC